MAARPLDKAKATLTITASSAKAADAIAEAIELKGKRKGALRKVSIVRESAQRLTVSAAYHVASGTVGPFHVKRAVESAVNKSAGTARKIEIVR